MAYNKRNWKARQGTGLNFFSIDGATPVPIVNQPTTLTEAGDALSAGNLNDWEQRIEDGFDDADASIANVQAQVDRNAKEIENLKQTTVQDEQTVSYPDDGNYSSIMPDGVPARVAKNASWDKSRGKSRAWNQLTPISTASTQTVNDVTFTNNGDGSWTVSGTASADTIFNLDNLPPVPSGHEILFVYGTTTVSGKFRIGDFNNGNSLEYGVSAKKYTASGAGIYMAIQVFSGTVINITFTPFVRDLTLIFPEGVPSTEAEAVAQIPDLLKWDANGTSLVDETLSGVKSVGVNIWDEVPYNHEGILESQNAIRVIPGVSYQFLYAGNVSQYPTVTLYWLDKNGNEVSRQAISANFPTPETTDPLQCPIGAEKLKFSVSESQVGTVYNHDIQICLYSLPVAIRTVYHPHMTDTLMLSTPVTLKSAGAVSEVLNVQTGKKTRPIGSVDLGDFAWSYITDAGRPAFWLGTLADEPLPVVGGQQICARGYSTNNPFGTDTDKIIYVYEAGGSLAIALRDSAITNSSSFSGMMLNYELATPLSDEQVCDPIPDNYIEVEGGGTIETIQEQSPVIDNCLDVTYDFIPA